MFSTAAFYRDFGEPVQVQQVNAMGIFDQASQVSIADTLVQAPALRVSASVVAVEGGSCIVRGRSYVIRQVLDLPPDAADRLLILGEVLA